MFEDGKCPMFDKEVLNLYSHIINDRFMKILCSLGCSVKCGEILKQELDKNGQKERYHKMH